MITLWRTIFSYPQVWIGILLTFLTVGNYGAEKAFALFFEPVTYKYAAAFAVGYAFLFERQYSAGRERPDIPATLMNAVVSLYIIVLVWGIGVFACMNYQLGGQAYGEAVKKKYRQGQRETISKQDAEVLKTLEALKALDNGKYKITPNGDGSFTVETFDN